MSLINDMLRDLDRRHGGAGALPNEVRPLPSERPRSPARLFAPLLVAALAFAGWFFMEGMPAPPPAATPASPPPTPVAKTPEPAPAPAAIVEPVRQPDATRSTDSLRLDTSLSNLPEPSAERPSATPVRQPAASASAKPAPQARVRTPSATADKTDKATEANRSAAVPSSGPAPAGASAKTAAVETSVAGGIEKRPRFETPKERAEQEYRKAYSLLSKGRTEEAVVPLRSALAEDAGHVPARLALAGVLSQSGRPDEAVVLLEEGLQRDPSQPALALSMARTLVAKGKFEAALQALVRASANANADAEYRAFHAAVLQRLTLHREAVAEYQAALRLSPQAGVWWMGLGISLEADGKQAEAKDAFQRARATGTLSAELNAFVDQKLKRLQ